MTRQLDITENKGAKANISDLKLYGQSDLFGLLSKASSDNEGFMKSTKVMDVPGGCVIQVSTQQRNPDGSFAVAEAVTFVPGVRLNRTAEPRRLEAIPFSEMPFAEVMECAAPIDFTFK